MSFPQYPTQDNTSKTLEKENPILSPLHRGVFWVGLLVCLFTCVAIFCAIWMVSWQWALTAIFAGWIGKVLTGVGMGCYARK